MSTISPHSVLLGSQQPRILRRPSDAVADGHREALRLCADLGLILDEWQELTLELWLSTRRDGSPAARSCGLNVPRQNGKSLPLIAVALDALFVARLPVLIWTAHEFDTAQEHFRRLEGICKSDDRLHKKVSNYYQSGQRTAIVLHTGERVEFKARTDKRGRGFSAPRVILDEAMFLGDPMMGALFPTMAAQSMSDNQPQLFYTGSAPLEKSSVWRRVQNRGITGEGAERLAYAEWSVDPDDYDVSDRAGWALANPGLGIRISEEYVADEFFEVGEREFVRERLGVPDPDPALFEASIDATAWHGCEDLRTSIDKVAAIGVDVDPEQTNCSIALAGFPVANVVPVEVPESRPRGDWLVPRILELHAKYGGTVVVQASGGAAAILPDLVAAGVPLVAVSQHDMFAACARFSNLVAEGKLRHRGEAHLNTAVMRARRRRVGDAFIWNRRDTADDISPLYASTLAAWPQEAEPVKEFFSF